MSNKEKYIIGGLGVAGIVVLVILVKGKSGNASSIPVAAGAPLGIPAIPQSPPLPALNVNATPYYMTFNMPQSRNLIPPPQPVADSCCEQCASKDVGSVPPASQDKLRRAMLSLAPHISFNPAV